MVKYFKFCLIISLLSNCVVSKKELNNQFIVNIVEFGAKPNDSQDDSDAIQMAIDFAIKSNVNLPSASVVYIPAFTKVL